MRQVLILLYFTINCFALEVDSFTNRHHIPEDSTQIIDDYINQKIIEAVSEANRDNSYLAGKGCHYWNLRRQIKKRFVAGPKGLYTTSPVALFVDKGKFLEQYLTRTKKRNSIYGDISYLRRPLMMVPRFAPLVFTNNSLIGSDKFSHLFNLGYLYYRRFEHGESTEDILKYGLRGESGLWGGATTGVISYGDLVANFQGLRFFLHLFGKGIDPLTKEDLTGNGIITCKYGRYEVSRRISFSDFIDDGMDEGINCSHFTSRYVAKKVQEKMDHLGMACPMENNRCSILREKYKGFEKYLLSDECI